METPDVGVRFKITENCFDSKEFGSGVKWTFCTESFVFL